MFEFLDEWIKGVEDFLKIPRGEVSRKYAPEAVAAVAEVPFDLLFEPLGAKIGKGLVGLVMALNGYFPNIDSRTREELHEMASHLLAEAFDPKPEDFVRIADAIQQVRSAISLGNPELALKAIGLKNPADIQRGINQVVSSISRILGLERVVRPAPQPPVAPAPAPQPAPSPAPAVEEELPAALR